MKKILVLGATGRIGQLLMPLLSSESETTVTAYVRDAQKAVGPAFEKAKIIEGDVLDLPKLQECMAEQDIVIAVLSGDLLTYAKNIASALQKNAVKRILWVTGMGIHHEVPGEIGKQLDELCRQMPEYIQAADTIAASGTPYTLIRAAHLTDGDNRTYFIHHEGETLHAYEVDRIAVAQFIADLISQETGLQESLGVTN